MIQVRRNSDRGHFDHGWLNTYHTFSFGDYHDPAHMAFRSLRVMNEDWVAAAKGFGMHGHRDMEIVTYVLEGELEHRDSMGNGSILRAGDFQRMTAGTGVRHSEFNPSPTDTTHLYQIWLLPERPGLTPSYEELRRENRTDEEGLRLVASGDRRDGALAVNQDARIYLGRIEKGNRLIHTIDRSRHGWLQVLRGGVLLNDLPLAAGDGAAIHDESDLQIAADVNSEVMLFDLA
ncbi:MAG: pirin family protein [Planctomycetes bacterium]|nr:pirin family protein [Planctomycetota bacterium]